MDDVSATKESIRRRMREMRSALPPGERARASRAICEKLAEVVPPSCGAVAVYLASPREIDLSHFILAMLRRGVAVAAPRWNGKSYELARLEGLSPESLRSGPMGILEPARGEAVAPSGVGAWIAPGLAFSSDGARIGYGGGWYDRLLAAADANAAKIGVAYDFQVLDDLPRAPHDVAVDGVVTPSREWRHGEGGSRNRPDRAPVNAPSR